MKSQWECVLENLGEWVGSFTTVTPQGELIEDIPSIINLAGIRDNQAIHLVLKRFYSLPNSTEQYAKEVVWDFSTPPGIGAIYFDTGAFSSGGLVVNIGVKTIAEFSLLAGDRRFRMIQTFDISQQLDRVTFVREHLQGVTTPERPHLEIADFVGTWTGIATTLYADDRPAIEAKTQSTFSVTDTGYQLVENDRSLAEHLLWRIDLGVDPKVIPSNEHTLGSGCAYGRLNANDFAQPSVVERSRNQNPSKIGYIIYRESNTPSGRLWQFVDTLDCQSYQLLLLPDGGYSITPTQIELGHAFNLEIGWMHQTNQLQRLVRRYDRTGKWESVTFITEQIDQSCETTDN